MQKPFYKVATVLQVQNHYMKCQNTVITMSLELKTSPKVLQPQAPAANIHPADMSAANYGKVISWGIMEMPPQLWWILEPKEALGALQEWAAPTVVLGPVEPVPNPCFTLPGETRLLLHITTILLSMAVEITLLPSIPCSCLQILMDLQSIPPLRFIINSTI